MNQKWYWIELIGFDKEQPDLGVEDFLSRIPKDICGISLLLYTVDFVCLHTGLAQEQPLPRAACSYGGHPYNEERKLQSWTNWELKRLIESLQDVYKRQVLWRSRRFPGRPGPEPSWL